VKAHGLVLLLGASSVRMTIYPLRAHRDEGRTECCQPTEPGFER